MSASQEFTQEFNININQRKKEEKDKGCIIRLFRFNPNGTYGEWEYQNTVTDEQRKEIEKILNISDDDYRK